MNNINYYEVCITVDNSNDNEEYWMCIRGIREPTVEEASIFLKKDEEMYNGHVTEVYPIEEDYARDCYDFSNINNWPTFGVN